MHECPNCGNLINEMTAEICPQCNFNFNETLFCAYNLSGRCVHTQKECNVIGLDYESCPTYLHKSGISN